MGVWRFDGGLGDLAQPRMDGWMDGSFEKHGTLGKARNGKRLKAS